MQQNIKNSFETRKKIYQWKNDAFYRFVFLNELTILRWEIQ